MGTCKRIVASIVLGLTAFSFAIGPPALAVESASAAEGDFVQRIDDARAEHGLRALAVRSDLVAVARAHSRRMADRDEIYHNPDLGSEVDGDWEVVGENVGVGPTVQDIHEAFMNSEHHRDNVLARDYNQMGVGVVLERGNVWVTEVFARRSSSPAPAPKPAPPPVVRKPAARVAAAARTGGPVPVPVRPRVVVVERARTVEILLRLLASG